MPYGWIDGFNDNFIRGWVWNSSNPNSPVTVKIVFANNETGKVWNYVQLANISRPDVAAAGYGTGNYGFLLPIDWSSYPPGPYTVRVLALNPDGTTYTEIHDSPKTKTVDYYGQVLDNGEYYINNGNTGGYLVICAPSNSQPCYSKTQSGTLEQLTNEENITHKWDLRKYKNGYCLVNCYEKNNSVYYAALCVGESLSSDNVTYINIINSDFSTESIPYECVWDISIIDGGILLRSRYNGKYLCDDNEALFVNNIIGSTSNINYYNPHIWRIVSTNQYGDSANNMYRELVSINSNIVNVSVGERTNISYGTSPVHKTLWTSLKDFYIASSYYEVASYADGNIYGISNGIATIYMRHKPTGLSFAFAVRVGSAINNIPVVNVRNYVDIAYELRFGGTLEVDSYYERTYEIIHNTFGIELNYLIPTDLWKSNADKCTGGLSNYTHDSSVSCGGNTENLHRNSQDLHEQLSQIPSNYKNINVIWTGHNLDGSPRSHYSWDYGEYSRITMTPYGIDETLSGQPELRYEDRVFTITHELSHALGAYDHYCEQDFDSDNKCSQSNCDICYKGLTEITNDIMGIGFDITSSNANIYCFNCLRAINEKINEHFF